MSSSDYNYDEQGQFFPFFILTITGLVTLPLTYSLLKPTGELEETGSKIKSDFRTGHDDLIQSLKAKQRRKERRLKRFIATLVGYAVMGYMIYLIIVTARITPKIYDPYEILGVGRSATEKDIKSVFRKLSLVYHPDKQQVTSNKTAEEANEYYVLLTKAYKALTDEEIRNNYVQFGHPDGKQSFSIGIALPKFIVTEGNGKYVLAFYGALLGVLLPYLVGRWWYGTQALTKEHVLVQSAGNLFKEFTENIGSAGIIKVVSAGEEFKQILNGNRAEEGLEKVEKAILKEGPERNLTIAGLQRDNIEKLMEMDGSRRKAFALLWAYMGRIELGDTTLENEKYEVAPIAYQLNEAFIAICLAFGGLGPLLGAYGASQRLIQAIPPPGSPLLQLPHMTPEIVRAIEGGPDVARHMTIQAFMELPEYQRRKLATDQPTASLTPAQYNDAMAMARQIPFVRVERAFFKCMGEKYITPSSLVQFVVKARIIPPGTADVPEVTADQLEDVDPDEEDLDGMLGRKAAKNARRQTLADGTEIRGSGASGTEIPEHQPPLTFAPYFARDHAPRWHLFLAELRQGRIAVPPTTITTFDQPIFAEEEGERGVRRPTFAVQTIKLQFQAPQQPGQYSFLMNLVSDSYIGMDNRGEVALVVEEMAKAGEIESEDEISEPDEDSLAGQMTALKQGGVADHKPKKKRVAKREESDDDDSDTEGEEGEDTSETDTETDTDDEK